MAAFPNSITDVQYKTEPDFSHSTRFNQANRGELRDLVKRSRRTGVRGQEKIDLQKERGPLRVLLPNIDHSSQVTIEPA
jgi:hypothetical protein